MRGMFIASWIAMGMAVLVLQSLAQMTAKSKSQISKGISAGQSVVDFMSKLGDPKEDKMFDNLGKMAGFLGAAGGLVSFALSFLPKGDSIELRYMKLKFAEVNMKLDRITLILDDVKDLITYENQRSAYLTSASRILFGHKQLMTFMDELQSTPCNNKWECYRTRARIASRFMNNLNIKLNLFTILNGATKRTSVFGDPLLQTIKSTFKCDVGKLDHFSNSILKLAFKAQQVILAHEKMTGTKISITRSMNDWLESIYNVRQYTFQMKNDCYRNIRQYMLADIKDKKYQVGVSSNEDATNQLKSLMDNKYPWLGWNIYSYGEYGGSKHCIIGTYGAFWSMPKGTNNRKRNVMSTLYDKKGTYKNIKYKVIAAIRSIVRVTNFYKQRKDACKILTVLVDELKIKSVWKYIASLNVMRSYSDLIIKSDKSESYFSREFTFEGEALARPGTGRTRYTYKEDIRLIVSLKSEEQASGFYCNLGCSGRGTCVVHPYSSNKYCQCKPHYQGSKCEDGTKAQLSKTIDAMLETTLTIPMISDVYFDIQEMRQYVGISFGKVQTAINEVERTLIKYMNNEFERANLITHYSRAIRSVEYYAHRFEALPRQYPNSTETEGKRLATKILDVDGIQKWLFEINFLFVGRSGAPLVRHKPLMHLYMEKNIGHACRNGYKASVDQLWREMVVLQQVGFLIWAQALELEGKATQLTENLYKQRVDNQIKQMKEKTCEYVIQHSTKINCTGGFYLHPGMTVENSCSNNYFINGSVSTTCSNKRSECQKCNCNPSTSQSQQCQDISRKCQCKPSFYGDKCTDRDCAWGPWKAYGSCCCSKACGIPNSKTRVRSIAIQKQGKGKAFQGSALSPQNFSEDCVKPCIIEYFKGWRKRRNIY